MPNLEYSVRFVLASDSTSEIDQALAKMRDTGSTITVKVNADASGFNAEMSKVNAEIQKAEASNEKLSRSAQKGSGLFRIYGKEIRQALNEFRATGDLDGANARLAEIKGNVEAFRSSLERSGQNMQEYFTLTNQLSSATNSLNSAYGNSTVAVNTSEVAQKALNAEARKSADIIRMNAQARAFDARQVKLSAQEIRDEASGQIALLRRLGAQGKGTADEISVAFGRIATTEEELTVTTEDLTQAFLRQQKAVEGSRMSFKNKQETINKLVIGEDQATQALRKSTASLGQQENQVGDVSYAMVSFTRLLEDMPYGFRGFANNIQPTVYGLIQLNDKTSAAAAEFRKMHNKEMPLAQRAMINFKSAMSSPINQLLLLTSVIAVAGTMIERWAQSANKAQRETKQLGDEFLRLYDVTKGDNPLETDYSQSIKGLEDYANAIESIYLLAEEAEVQNQLNAGMSGASLQGAGMMSQQLSQITKDEAKRFLNAKELNQATKDRLLALQAEADVQLLLLSSDEVRVALQNQMNERRVQTANDEIIKTQDLIDIEKVRQAQGEEAAIRYESSLRTQKINADETLDLDQKKVLLNAESLTLEYNLLKARKNSTKAVKEIRNEYDGILLSLQRQLEDETKMSDFARLQVSRRREIADLEAEIAQRRKDGEDILPEQERKLISLVNRRYDVINARAELASEIVVANLARQVMLSDKMVRAEQELLFGDEARGVALDIQIQHMEVQAQLAERLHDISQDDALNTEQKVKAQASITREMQNQLRMSLMRQQAEARRVVQEFLFGKESEEARIEQATYDARIANARDFAIEKAKIDQKDYKSRLGYLLAIGQLDVAQAITSVKITKKGEDEKNYIRKMGYIQGSMVIVDALEQLNQSSEAKSKKAFERQKAFSAGLATINTLLGITQVLSDTTIKSTFLKYAQASALAIIGFAQVKKIQSARYGGSTSSAVGSATASQGFQEVNQPTQNASAGVIGTMGQSQFAPNIYITGNVDREGIAFAVRDGEDSIASRATFARI